MSKILWPIVDFVRVFFFISARLSTVSHYIVCDKLKAMDVNPYITNWIISFLTKRQQRVVVDGKSTEFASLIEVFLKELYWGPFYSL